MELQSIGSPSLWVGFVLFVLAMLALDLGVFHRESRVVRFKEALTWSLVWISIALLFGAGVYAWFGAQPALEFYTGYMIEKSLSIDNIFVFVVIFSAFSIPPIYQHRILFWGIIGALLMRAVMIFAGTAMLARFHWLIYLFGGFLVLTGVRLFLQRNQEEHPEEGWSIRLARRLIPSTDVLDGDKFFTVENGKRLATPLFMALILVEVTDLIFAVDSIPAIFAVTTDPFIVFTSNIFAILGLRSLFFLLADLVDKFVYLKIGLSAVLVFVGAKMMLIDLYKIPSLVSLGVVLFLLGGSMLASWLRAKKEPPLPAKGSAPIKERD